jgi:hypothetical protein
MHGVYILAVVSVPYLFLSYTVALEAVARPYIHDFIHLEHPSAHSMIAVLITLDFLLCVLSKPNYDLLCKRISLLALLKGISQAITIVPQPGGVDECVNMSFWDFKNCADMMFSGHTCFTFLVLYKTRFRNFFTFAMAFELVMGKWHYMSDCFMACIAGYAIEKYLPDESYL